MDILQWAVEMWRNPDKDRSEALSRTAEECRQEFYAGLADYDAFVEDALTVTDGIYLGDAVSSRGEVIPIRMRWDEEYVHWILQGTTGMGKTKKAISVAIQKLQRNPPRVGAVDFKSDFHLELIRWCAAIGQTLDPISRGELHDGLIVINPFADALAPLNVCRLLPGSTAEYQAYEITLALSRLLDSGLGAHQENILRHLLLLLIELGEALSFRLSLLETLPVLSDELLRGILATRSSHREVKEFFLRHYASIAQVSKDALFNRLNALFLSESMRLMLGADDLIDLRTMFDRGDVLAGFLGKGPGVSEELVEVIGSLFLQLLFQAVYAGGSGRRRGYLLFLDEFFHLLESAAMVKRFQTALSSARSYGLSLALMNQNFAQLPTGLRELVAGNCDVAAIFRTNTKNAECFGDFLPQLDPEVAAHRLMSGKTDLKPDRRAQLEAVQRLPKQECYLYDRRKPHRAIRIRVPDVPEPHEFAGLSANALDEIIRAEGWDRGSAAIPRVELRAQIERRHRKLRELVNPPVVISERKPASSKAESSTTKKKTRIG